MKKHLLFFILLCISATLKAQTDTVTAKIRKLPFIHVDVAARFPAGDFSKYIAANFNYKKKSDRNLSGEVIVSMKIDSTGQVSNVNVLKSMLPDIDREVVRVIRSSPKWQPAIQKSKPIGVYLVFNIDMGIIGSLAPVKPVTPPVKSAAVVVPPVVTVTKKTEPDPKKPNVLIGPPAPVPEKKTVLKAIKKQVPPFDKKPVPVEKKPLPQIAKKATPPPVIKKLVPIAVKTVEKKPVPQVAKKVVVPPVVKPVVKKPAPQVAKKVIPPPVVKPVEKKPLPQIAKKVVISPPVVKPVEKKPVPQVAKVILPPAAKAVEKKPVPEIAKKVTPTVLTPVKTKPVVVKKSKKAADDDNVRLKPSSEALFPDGGQPGFFRYLSDNINYPILSKVNKIEGEVRVTFFVEKDGTISDIKTLSAPAEDLAQEAKRVILASPKWKPAMQNGIPVREPFTVPINFKIQDSKASGQ